MNYRRLSHQKLIKIIAKDTGEEQAWREFYQRYHTFLFFVARKACERMGHKNGLRYIEDLVQDVYKRLVDDSCRRLRIFKSKNENGIFKYLQVITVNIVKNDQKREEAEKRPPVAGKKSINETIGSGESSRTFEEILEDCDALRRLTSIFDEDEIAFCLQRIYSRNKHRGRNMRIFSLLCQGYKPQEIAADPQINIKPKTVGNIITQMKKELPVCLKRLRDED